MEHEPHRARSKRRRRLLGLVLLAAAGGAAFCAVELTSSSGVGGFRSERGRSAYAEAYRAAMERLPPPTRRLDVDTDFGTVRVYEFASSRSAAGVPVVLVPGRSSGVPMWADNLAELAAERTVYALDALGDAGMSVQTRPITDGADQAAWLDQVIARLGLPEVHLVGHSFGGWNAANCAARRPGRVASLALLEPVFVLQGLRWQVYVISLPASLPFLPGAWRDRMLAAIGGGGPIDRTDPVARMIAEATEHYAARLPLPERLTSEQLSGLRMPVLVALGGRSSMHDSAAALAVARASVPNVTARVWPDAGHSLPMEYAAELDRALLDFFARHDTRDDAR